MSNGSFESKHQEEQLQALIDSSPLALVEFGLDTRIRLWNPAAERIFGWSREEMLGRGDLPMAPPSKRAESEELFARVRAGESINDYETVRRRKDGTLVDVSIAAAPVRDATGRVVGNMVAYTDITERKAQDAEVHRLNAELHARLEELAASRARIVTAGDVARRRLERNLHDGAQQRLVTLSLSLRVARTKLDSDPAAARAALAEATDELAFALDELRELARGLHPAILSERGLRAAVETLAGRVPVPVEIVDIPEERLPEPVEAAAYYLIAEALTNVTKYAQASTVRVHVVESDGSVLVEVSDDGVGGADPAGGSGLRGLADRVEALGGSLDGARFRLGWADVSASPAPAREVVMGRSHACRLGASARPTRAQGSEADRRLGRKSRRPASSRRLLERRARTRDASARPSRPRRARDLDGGLAVRRVRGDLARTRPGATRRGRGSDADRAQPRLPGARPPARRAG
jgi:PAS domain S-box-containing protein